jgi:hypothetical protein
MWHDPDQRGDPGTWHPIYELALTPSVAPDGLMRLKKARCKKIFHWFISKIMIKKDQNNNKNS